MFSMEHFERKNIYLQCVDVNLGFVISRVIGFDQLAHYVYADETFGAERE